ncbi:MAG: F0F1 ATP synthase subunit beta, partial [Kiritimatiellia bacterium]
MPENIGHILQVLGAVVDVEFESGIRPRLQTALRTTNPLLNDQPDNLVMEVAQHLGDCRVRA